MITRALAQDTPMIILDEPTTHLDMYHKAYLLKLLKQLTIDTGKTILFSSHEIDLAIQLCDSMIVMTKDQVVSDQPCNLISNGIFESLFSFLFVVASGVPCKGQRLYSRAKQEHNVAFALSKSPSKCT